jgi:hypothetical protein
MNRLTLKLLAKVVVDEAYFLGARDMSSISERLQIATGNSQESYGGLNWATSCDPCQLAPPVGKTLFDQRLTTSYKSKDPNDLNEGTRHDV